MATDPCKHAAPADCAASAKSIRREGLRRIRLSAAALVVGAGFAVPCAAETAADAQAVTLLEQGWDENLRQLFYYTPQGSRLIPVSWLLALERTDGPGGFADPDYLRSFGWIYHAGASPELNPAGLPIGFAIDPAKHPEGSWAGFTCAACHTGEIDLDGTRVRVDGGPGNADVDLFFAALTVAVRATVLDPDRFQRFAEQVLGQDHTPEAETALRGSLAIFEANLSGDAALRHSPVASGFGRVDAVNQIVNAIAVRDLGAPENYRTADAPVSLPHLWLAPRLDWVQWNPIASNPLGRNVGEVLGVFGSADLRSGTGTMFQSTALLPQLIELEAWLGDLEPPPWPAQYPIDAARAAEGKALFARDCAACHNMAPWRMTEAADNAEQRQFIRVGRVPAHKVGTDPTYMQSFQARTAATGPLAAPLFANRPVVPGSEFFIRVVGAVVGKAVSELSLTADESDAANGYRSQPVAAAGSPPADPNPASPPCEKLNCLKAGVLVGIWATGPYLHNGSVPTVYELLSPPEERSKVFWVGGRSFDPERLGFVSTEQPGLFRFDTSERGNGNGGHVFPPGGYTHDERMAVIEYLKEAQP